MRRFVVNRSDLDRAREIRETFQDAPSRKVEPVSWQWPRAMREIGSCEAVMYTSDKWRHSGDMVDYKHLSEGPQRILVKKDFLREYHYTEERIPVCGPEVELNRPMPSAFAVLAPILGVQVRLYEPDARGEPTLSRGDIYQVVISRAMLGGAEHPDTREKFLIIYTKRELCAIIVGDILDIEKDGIVG